MMIRLPKMPVSSAMTAKMLSNGATGKPVNLTLDCPIPTPKKPPVNDGFDGANDLIGRQLRVLDPRHITLQTCPAGGVYRNGDPGGEDSNYRNQNDLADLTARNIEKDATDQDYGESSADVWLEDDQTSHQTDDGSQGKETQTKIR